MGTVLQITQQSPLLLRATVTRAHARRSPIKRELTEESARWRHGRRSPDFRRTKIAHRVFERNKRLYQTGRRRRTDHVDLWRRRLEIRFLFRILSRAHGMAKRTRVSAIKSLSNRLAQGRALRVIDDHRCPRHRLKSNPMQTNRATKCNYCGDAGDVAKHDCEASDEFI
jgi:hypothetical protein